MNRIVVYSSVSGFTKQYAEWIAEELSCEAKEWKAVEPSSLMTCDQVIYGGYIMAGRIMGYDKISALGLNNLIVYATGLTKPTDEFSKKLAADNKVKAENFFYLPGGYRPERLGFLKRSMLGMIRKSAEKKEVKTEDDIYTLEMFNGVNKSNRALLEDLLKLTASDILPVSCQAAF